MMQDGAGNSIGPVHEGDGTDIQTIYQGDGTVLWQADGAVVIDDFERGNLDRYGGATDEWEVNQNSPVTTGDYSLKKPSGDFNNINSTSGLSTYPEQGDIIRIDVSHGRLPQFLFGVNHDESSSEREDCYAFAVNEDYIELRLYENNDETILAEASFDTPDGGDYDYTMEIDWGTDGSIICAVLDTDLEVLESITSTDTTFDSGGIGFRDRGDEGVMFDNVRIL